MMTRTQPSRASPLTGADPQADALGWLTKVLERMWHAPAAQHRVLFEAPKYEGKGDVELFVRQFSDVAQANEWPRAAALLHLRRALKDGATDCGRAETVEGIFNALRARYGLTPMEARAKLVAMRRDSKTTLQEHSTEVERLVEVAYAEIPQDLRRTMSVDIFSSTIGNGYLQRHLLAVPTPTLDEAVKASNEYLQVQTGYRYPKQSIHGVEDGREEEEDEPRQPVSTPTRQVAGVDPMVELMKVMRALTDKVEALNQPQRYPEEREQRMSSQCYNCGGTGHWSRDCRRRQAPQGFSPQ